MALSITVITPCSIDSIKGSYREVFGRSIPPRNSRCYWSFLQAPTPTTLLNGSERKRWLRTPAKLSIQICCQFLSQFPPPTIGLSSANCLPAHLLTGMLSPKGRLPWKTVCLLMAQIARGLDRIHHFGLVHGSLSPSFIWVQKKGTAQLRLPITQAIEPDSRKADKQAKTDFNFYPPAKRDDSLVSAADDVFAFGSILIRSITGRDPETQLARQENPHMTQNQDAEFENVVGLHKYDLPEELKALIKQLVSPNPSDRMLDLNQLSSHLGQFCEHPKSPDLLVLPTHPSAAAFRESLHRFEPGSQPLVESVPAIDTGEARLSFDEIVSAHSSSELTAERAKKIKAATTAAQQRRKNRWKHPATVAASLLILGSAIGVWAISANRKIVRVPAIPAATEKLIPEEVIRDPIDSLPPPVDLAALRPSERPILRQELVAVDSDSLWETPTTGPPVDFSGIPLAPKLIFVFRPEAIASQPEGLRLLQSLGPEFNSRVDHWISQSGMALADISQLIVSLHTTADFEYEAFFLVTTTQPREFDQLLQIWNRPTLSTTENGQTFLTSTDSDQAFYPFSPGDNPASWGDSNEIPPPVSRFAFGRRALIEEVASNLAANPLTGSLKKISNWTDRERHVNLLFLRNSLFNDEGQDMMGPRLKNVNRELAILIPASVRGGLFSMHLDEGTYLEMMLDRSLDLESEDLITLLIGELRIQRDRLTELVSRIPRSTYWDRVRQRYDNMLADLFRNLRWDSEHGEVVANCWLPPMAAHNLIAASELVVSFSSGSEGTRTPAIVSGPRTIEELLTEKRDLVIANPPDLNVLMKNIETEVNDDFPDLPFPFRIRMLGADLEEQGITKNQRPGELNINQLPLGDILTAIMVGANPAKDISGPADPNCQLIWVIAEDPDSIGEKAVLITTRTAANQKSYELPQAFVSE